MPTQSILVPTDFSELSRRALRAAERWAMDIGGRVTPMHAYEPVTDLAGFHFFGPDSRTSGRLDEIEAAVCRSLAEFAAKEVAAERLQAGRFVLGDPAQAIARASLDHDLVVISSHGRSGLAHFLLGAVADKAIQLVPSPVLLMHDVPVATPLRRILVAVDLSPASAEVLPLVHDLAQASGAVVEFLHVHVCRAGPAVRTRALEERVQAFAAAHDLSDQRAEVAVLVTTGSVQDALAQYVCEREADLVAMATVGDAIHGPQLLGPTPARVVREIRVPLLLVSPATERQRKRALLEA